MRFPDSDRGEHLGDAFRLDREKQLLKQYYAGQQMESPNGGFLICLGIRQEETGDAVGIFECNASWIRYEVTIRKATRTERKKVRDALTSGEEPACPRCVINERLVRAGKALVCNHCGIAYGKV
ncbi:MAG: hypothetical protein CME18_02245 [Gemmatimonadetes bacterium]|nr:hypothetical protein [Gemmatimonadota bacterium]